MADEISDKDIKDFKLSEVVPVYATTFSMQGSGNDFTILFQRLRPVMSISQGTATQAAVAEPTAIVTMSPQTLRDLKELIDGAIVNYEKDFGKIVTAHTRRKQADKS